MNDVEQRATRDHEYHDDDVCLHDNGWYECRKLRERIDSEHQITPMLASYYQRKDRWLGCSEKSRIARHRILLLPPPERP